MARPVRCYLCCGDDRAHGRFARFESLTDAKASFKRQAEELARYEQVLTGQIHIAARKSEIVDDPDLYLELGPRGGLVVHRG